MQWGGVRCATGRLRGRHSSARGRGFSICAKALAMLMPSLIVLTICDAEQAVLQGRSPRDCAAARHAVKVAWQRWSAADRPPPETQLSCAWQHVS